ncbi:serine-rich adhesin for platelets isoform X1 [Stomoxys calcitrans]|uniref:serine-rich adhesin for platelets isoform X1 n=2 Tax=Stomoxys calcitrans TaxID=35570 RepID=UPI0027E26F8A|nr:serine-rich adhesin for platelets isoform X1 [Stomoxys calcitrans]
MDFPQQIEETLVARSPSVYDVVMESPLYAGLKLDHRSANNFNVMDSYGHRKIELTSTSVTTTNNLSYIDKMASSMNSSTTMDDTTPSDSGVQMLDSESSELMVESITSQTGFEFEESNKSYEGLVERGGHKDALIVVPAEETTVIDSNSNVTAVTAITPNNTTTAVVEEAMTISQCSTFDTTENIVYRRKVRKTPSVPKAPKKRVSFHEDILKNTRTDNIHIEHGFITYKAGGQRRMAPMVGQAGRYSWCSEGDRQRNTELCDSQEGDEEGETGPVEGGPKRRGRVVYRNACSDVLDYGNSDVYDMNDSHLQYDNSGVFEYVPKEQSKDAKQLEASQAKLENKPELYKCSCSSSNSSLDSDENDKNSNGKSYGQAKSNSCDCIGMSNTNNNIIGDNCYYSEPNIDFDESPPRQKSVWNKEKKPKSSCLKKTKCQTNIIHEQDLNTKVKKFNVHDMNQLLDNSSKMIFGSLKSIFTMPLPERGVPEGSEDLQAVIECVPELEQTPEHKPKVMTNFNERPDSPPLKQKPFLSKSLDGSKQQPPIKKFVHNVDEQLRRNKDEDMFAAKTQDESATKTTPQLVRQMEFETDGDIYNAISSSNGASAASSCEPADRTPFRNKFIINCESTVFEHTGVSYCYETSSFNDLNNMDDLHGSIASLIEKDTPIAQPEPELKSAFSAPIAKTFSNFFRSFKDAGKDKTSPKKVSGRKQWEIAQKQAREEEEAKQMHEATENYFALKMPKRSSLTPAAPLASSTPTKSTKFPSTTSSSTISELTNNTSTSTSAQAQHHKSNASLTSGIGSGSGVPSTPRGAESLAIGSDLRNNLEKQSRHLPSPIKKRLSATGSTLIQQNAPPRYGLSGPTAQLAQQQQDMAMFSPDLYHSYMGARGGSGRDSKSTILSEEFDDILTITTDTERNESDIVIVDYQDVNDRHSAAIDYGNLLKPPQPPAKTSLINRFLRNVTQKKILESSIRRNNFFAQKLKTEKSSGNLYVKGAKPRNLELIEDLNAEIAMEIEMSGVNNSPRKELASLDGDLPGDLSRFELGIGEISIDVFAGVQLNILKDVTEQLLKVFKLYTGYSKEGYMTPVLVLLTDRSIYVTDLVRNKLCSKFVLAYKELDVILMGPYGNTVLLSNSNRDKQQVLLAGGPYPAAGLVANLELCARRSGSVLPAVGQLTLDHLAPLQNFVRENSCVGKHDAWMYYAVVNVPGAALGDAGEQEPLGPHAKGFLMHRRVKEHLSNTNSKQYSWNPGYFLLKAGVLYMFNDSTQKIPSWAMALAECQGARRAVKALRPHCFEIMLKNKMLLQLAAPDEYVASEWLQALLQSASGLFEMQEKHKTLGCTLVVTQNHLITLREDFSAPLRKLKGDEEKEPNAQDSVMGNTTKFPEDDQYLGDTVSLLSSTMSTPTRNTQRSTSSMNSTPTKLSQLSRSTTTCNTTLASSLASNVVTPTYLSTHTTRQQVIHATAMQHVADGHHNQMSSISGNSKQYKNSNNNNSMSSVYGKNSGLEILTCADIKEMTGIKIPSHTDTWWCILEFSCQEVRECSDDLVIFFASSTEMQRFLRLLEQLWQAKNNDLFPICVLDEDDIIAEQCTMLYMDINRSWEPLLSAALGYPL